MIASRKPSIEYRFETCLPSNNREVPIIFLFDQPCKYRFKIVENQLYSVLFMFLFIPLLSNS